MIAPERCSRMIGSDVLAGHDRAAQIDRADAVEGLFRDLERRGIAAGDADPDIVVQDVDAAPFFLGSGHGGGKRLLLGDVGLKGDALAAFLRHHVGGLLRPGEIAVDGQDAGALLREAEARRAAVAHPGAGPWPAPTMTAILSFRRISNPPRLPPSCTKPCIQAWRDPFAGDSALIRGSKAADAKRPGFAPGPSRVPI